MPVHDLGYREWSGKRTPRLLRPWVVARGGISLIWRRRWLRMMLVVAWLPIILPDMQGVVAAFLGSPLLQRGDLAAAVMDDPAAVRHEVWSTLILFFFRYPQLFAMVLLIGLIAPLLISYDLRSKAYLLYFSRPLVPWEYILGKSAVIWFFLGMTVTLPAVVLYVAGVLLSPDLSVVMETWDIPLRILMATVVLVVPTTAVALAYSSFTTESRYASFAWFATWVMGYVSYMILTFARVRSASPGPRPRRRRGGGPDWEAMGVDLDRWRLLSPYHALGKVESWVFGLDPTEGSVYPSLLLLIVVTILTVAIIRRRIVARLNV